VTGEPGGAELSSDWSWTHVRLGGSADCLLWSRQRPLVKLTGSHRSLKQRCPLEGAPGQARIADGEVS
jgi:hypothetical protein